MGVPAGRTLAASSSSPRFDSIGSPMSYRRTSAPTWEQAAVQHRLQPGRPGCSSAITARCRCRKARGHHDPAPMREVAAVANAEGVPLSEEDVAAWVDIIDHLPSNGETSMRRDGKTTGRAKWSCLQAPFAGWPPNTAFPSLSTTGCTSGSRRWSGTTEPVQQRDKCRSSVLHSNDSVRCLRTGTLESPRHEGAGASLFPYQPQPVQPVGAPQVPDSAQENLHHRGGRVASPRWNRELSAARLHQQRHRQPDPQGPDHSLRHDEQRLPASVEKRPTKQNRKLVSRRSMA